MIISFFEKDKYRLILLNNYLDLLLYIYKLEIDMKCNPRYTKILINYPYKFRDLNHNHIRNYFNSFQTFWKYSFYTHNITARRKILKHFGNIHLISII